MHEDAWDSLFNVRDRVGVGGLSPSLSFLARWQARFGGGGGPARVEWPRARAKRMRPVTRGGAPAPASGAPGQQRRLDNRRGSAVATACEGAVAQLDGDGCNASSEEGREPSVAGAAVRAHRLPEPSLSRHRSRSVLALPPPPPDLPCLPS
uniref:Uncharacterized protein n=1 Tax=Oryza sativa subsp. japonica TaxID=39947 RepID=Q6K391_ORYSJ|nr:hypothetical protein [Oryza sativa Japonica Group]BAD22427.1 hypothetical protein [Oryza sativa Japonica Group]